MPGDLSSSAAPSSGRAGNADCCALVNRSTVALNWAGAGVGRRGGFVAHGPDAQNKELGNEKVYCEEEFCCGRRDFGRRVHEPNLRSTERSSRTARRPCFLGRSCGTARSVGSERATHRSDG